MLHAFCFAYSLSLTMYFFLNHLRVSCIHYTLHFLNIKMFSYVSTVQLATSGRLSSTKYLYPTAFHVPVLPVAPTIPVLRTDSAQQEAEAQDITRGASAAEP